MTDLHRAIYQFAQKNRICPLLCAEEEELQDNQNMIQSAREGLLMSSAIEQEASFLAGLTIGLELGRG